MIQRIYIYPDLYLLVRENYKISDRIYGYTDSMSADNNLMVLVELTGLSNRYGTTIYAVDRVNGTMYGKFSGDCRVINERATVRPQFRPASLKGKYVSMQPTYANTLPGTTSMVTPLAKIYPNNTIFVNAYNISCFAPCKGYIRTCFK